MNAKVAVGGFVLLLAVTVPHVGASRLFVRV